MSSSSNSCHEAEAIPGILRNYSTQVPAHFHEHAVAPVHKREQALPVTENGADHDPLRDLRSKCHCHEIACQLHKLEPVRHLIH